MGSATPGSTSARRWPWLTTILAVALALRIAAALAVEREVAARDRGPFLIAGDAEGYWMLGRQLANGGDFAVYDPPRRVLRMPGFPALLAASQRLFGESMLAARLVLAVVGTVAVGLTFLLGRMLFDERVAIGAGWFAAVAPPLVGFSVLVLSETTFAATLLLSLLAMAWLLRGLRETTSIGTAALASRAVVVGVAIALATLVRPSWLPIAPLFAVGLVIGGPDRRRAAWAGAVVCAATFVALLPWAWRNHDVTGAWVFTTLWAGPSLYDGLNPQATGASDMRFFDDDALAAKGMSEVEVDRRYRERAWAFVREQPLRAIQLAGLKLLRYGKPWPTADEFGGAAVRFAWGATSLLLFASAAGGAWRHRRAGWLIALTAGPILFLALVHAVFVGSLRYRLPAEYPLCVLAAAGWVGVRRIEKKNAEC